MENCSGAGGYGLTKEVKLQTNLIYNIGYQILAIILPLVTTPYVSRVLGLHNVGVYSYTNAFANYFYLFAMLGVNNYGNRTIAGVRHDREKMSTAFWEIYIFQFSLSVLIMAIYLLYCIAFVSEDGVVYFMQFFYIASAAFNVNWLCFGLERFKLTTIRNIMVRLAMAAAIFLFVKKKTDLPIYTAILAAGNLLSVLAVWPFVLQHVSFVKPSVKGIIKHVKPNVVLFWPVIAVSLYNIMDKLMLGWMSTKEEVGFYTYAENIVQIPNTLILALDNVVMPRMSNLYATEKGEKAKKLMDNVMMFAMLMAAAMAFGLAGVGPIFAPWFYGDAFSRCGLFIVMLCPVIVCKGWAGALRTQFIIPTKRDKVYIISLTTGAAVNLIVNLLFIPKYAGIGAVIGTITAEFAVCFIQFFMTRREIDIKSYLINGVSFCVIGAVMYLIVFMLGKLSLNAITTMGLQILAGAVVYILCSYFFMVKIRKNPVLVHEGLRILHLKK